VSEPPNIEVSDLAKAADQVKIVLFWDANRRSAPPLRAVWPVDVLIF
jgi:hypothetical protein